MKIAILGAAGQMGRWLIKYFSTQGHDLTVSDVRSNALKKCVVSSNVKIAEDNLMAIKNVEAVVVSVPIENTATVLYEIAPYLKKDVIVAEIASIKLDLIKVLIEISKLNIIPLSLHPLFGPGLQKMKKKLAVIPVLNKEFEKQLAKKFFPDAKIVVVDSNRHDKAMAITLSFPYFLNMALASILNDEDINLLKELSGTTFNLQLILTGSVMAQSSKLHSSIHMANKYSLESLKKFVSEAEKILNLIEKKDVNSFLRFYNGLQKTLSKNLDLLDMYKKMYIAQNLLQGTP
jgi:prephenate dehydrogenase